VINLAVNLKLKALRVGEGLNQKDMCALLGLKGEGSYSMMENGRRQFKQAHIATIAQRFKLDGEQIKEIFLTINLP
jgi:transcriptional regulator with XRE-family HTH domain